MENWILEEDWSNSNLVEEEDWCIPDIEEARVKSDKIEFEKEKERLLKRKRLPLANLSGAELRLLPLANLSGAELRQEGLRIMVACGLYPEEEIQSVHYRKRQMGCKDKNILTDRVTTTEKAESSGEGIKKEALAKLIHPDE